MDYYNMHFNCTCCIFSFSFFFLSFSFFVVFKHDKIFFLLSFLSWVMCFFNIYFHLFVSIVLIFFFLLVHFHYYGENAHYVLIFIIMAKISLQGHINITNMNDVIFWIMLWLSFCIRIFLSFPNTSVFGVFFWVIIFIFTLFSRGMVLVQFGYAILGKILKILV